MASNSKTKVSSFTQVEPEFVRTEIRSIVGQEDKTENNLSQLVENLSIRKQNKGIRPPLVGQASSSSNDSVEGMCFVIENSEQNNPTAFQSNSSETTADLQVDCDQGLAQGINGINFIKENYITVPCLLNRDDFINQRPPEGSSNQVSAAIIQPFEFFQELPRNRSPSSASSVTSGKPLEWDSGADVGYNQHFVHNDKLSDPLMRTIESMGLARGKNLLTRSDPEGTTGPSRVPQPVVYKSSVQSKFRFRKKLGYPNAESTPFGTCLSSNASPEENCDISISPILCEGKVFSRPGIKNHSSGSENDEGYKCDLRTEIESQSVDLSSLITKNPRLKIPLFPEIVRPNSSPISPHEELDSISFVGSRQNVITQSCEQLQEQDEKIIQSRCASHFQSNNTPKQHTSITQTNNKLGIQCLKDETNLISCSSKKLSSSLENIYALNNVSSGGKSNSNTLPRSQSHLNLNSDYLADENVEEKNENRQKYSMPFHSLIQYNKSASSSSVATVVHKKRESPKHVFAQTSVLKQESIGIQVSESNILTADNSLSKNNIKETPHIQRKELAHVFPKRSNYFDFESSGEKLDSENELRLSCLQEIRAGDCDKLESKKCINFHNGISCTGAHKRIVCSSKVNNTQLDEYKNQHCPKFDMSTGNTNMGLNNTNNRPITQGSSNNINCDKFATSTIDSVESSAKSCGFYTDKQYSVTVEDRVNSFEYLPGHVYENTDRQQPVDSHGTSSISIRNQTSNNEMAGERNKIWENSVSASSTLENDIERGVNIISDFVKGSCSNNNALKQKLIMRVVERLISNNYIADTAEPADLNSNVPWVPVRCQNSNERSGRETRRSLIKSKVPCEFSSRSEKSGSTNASSECFIPRPAGNTPFLPSSLRDNWPAGVTGQESHSSTSEISIEKSTKNHGNPSNIGAKAKVIQNGYISKDNLESSSSNKVSRNSNWREPATRTEKIIEEKKKMCSEAGSSQSDAKTVEKCLNMERENLIFWICSQIKYLSNQKEFLEKQEKLKQVIEDLKTIRQGGSEKAVLKERNKNRVDKEKGGSNMSRGPEIEKSPAKAQRKSQPTLGAWFEKTLADAKEDTTISSAVMTDNTDGWESHTYRPDHLRSCMKRKNKHQPQKGDKRVLAEAQRDTALYDEPPLHSYRERTEEAKPPRPPPTPYHPRVNSRPYGRSFVSDKDVTKKNTQTETLVTVGVQTSDSIQQSPPVHHSRPRQKTSHSKHSYGRACLCKCCHDRNNLADSTEDEKKSPVGYYISFEPSPRELHENTNVGLRPLEEVKIPVPMSEPKQRHSRRPSRSGFYSERVNLESDVVERERSRAGADMVGSETETASSQTNEDRGSLVEGRPIYKQCAAGSLQYYLLNNRPSYVSRAEDRRQCIAQMQYLRELREDSKRRLLRLTESVAPCEQPPPPTRIRRVFSQQTMRRQTEKKYRQLTEVRSKQEDTKRKEGYRTNRLMAEIFKKKLQKRVLKGEVNLSNSVSVISNL